MRKKRDIGNPEVLYKACKQMARDEAKCYAEPDSLAQIWHKAVQQDINGQIFRKYVIHNYETALAWNDLSF